MNDINPRTIVDRKKSFPHHLLTGVATAYHNSVSANHTPDSERLREGRQPKHTGVHMVSEGGGRNFLFITLSWVAMSLSWLGAFGFSPPGGRQVLSHSH